MCSLRIMCHGLCLTHSLHLQIPANVAPVADRKIDYTRSILLCLCAQALQCSLSGCHINFSIAGSWYIMTTYDNQTNSWYFISVCMFSGVALTPDVGPLLRRISLGCSVSKALADANAANRKTLLALGIFAQGFLTCSFALANALARALSFFTHT